MAQKSKVLLIKTGGTVCQERDAAGILHPTSREYLDHVSGIQTLAAVTPYSCEAIDSTNITTQYRAVLAQLIYDRHNDYDGFVIVHGTDSMTSTAAALSYMLPNLGKPIVLTGSQVPIFDPGTDAVSNLYHAVAVACEDIGEVVISFGAQVLRGNRAVKKSEHGRDAFHSYRSLPLGEIGIGLKLTNQRIRRSNTTPSLFVDFDTSVEGYTQTSGTSPLGFVSLVDNPEIHGIVFSAFGSGNIRSDLLPSLERATAQSKPIVLITNCLEGTVEVLYKVGADAVRAGVIPAGDMTLEAATQKLMYALGKGRHQGYNGKELLSYVQEEILTEVARDIQLPKQRKVA